MKFYRSVNGHRIYLLNDSAYQIEFSNGLIGIYQSWVEVLRSIESFTIRNAA
jgi:hypothetical protein